MLGVQIGNAVSGTTIVTLDRFIKTGMTVVGVAYEDMPCSLSGMRGPHRV